MIEAVQRFLLTSLLLLAPAVAAAQGAPSEPPPAAGFASGPLDTVRLRAGGFVRGHVVEYDPAVGVRILLADGEIRTLPASAIAAVEEAAASTASTASPAPTRAATPTAGLGAPERSELREHAGYVGAEAPAAPTAPAPGELSARFDSDDHGVALFRLTGYRGTEPTFEALCTPPCDAHLPAGDHEISASYDGGELVAPEHLRLREDGAHVEVDYHDRSALRVGGWILAFAGPTVFGTFGSLAIWYPQFRCCGSQPENAVLSATGYTLMLSSVVVGVLMSLADDDFALEQAEGEAPAIRF